MNKKSSNFKKIFLITTTFSFLFALLAVFLALVPNISWTVKQSPDKEIYLVNSTSFMQNYKIFLNFFFIIMIVSILFFIAYLLTMFFVKKEKDIKITNMFFSINFIIQAIFILILLPVSIAFLTPNVDYDRLKANDQESLIKTIKRGLSIQATIHSFSYIFAIGLFSSCVFFFVKRKEMRYNIA